MRSRKPCFYPVYRGGEGGGMFPFLFPMMQLSAGTSAFSREGARADAAARVFRLHFESSAGGGNYLQRSGGKARGRVE